MTANETAQLLTLREASALLGVRSATLRAQIARGRLSAQRRGRDWHVTRAECERYQREVQQGSSSRASWLEALLAIITSAFEATAEWPTTRALQRQLIHRGLEVDLMEASRSLDPALGHIDRAGQTTLTIRGLARGGAAESVGDFEDAMRLAIDRYRDPNIIEPRIGSDDFPVLSPLRRKRLYQLLSSNPLVTGGGGGTDQTWSLEVSERIHLLGRARTINGYVAALDRLATPSGLQDLGPRRGDWPDLEARISDLGRLLERAESRDEVQDIGRRCREIVNDLSDELLASLEPPVDGSLFGADRKAKIDAFLERTTQGPSAGELRRLVRATYDLANAVTHSSRGARSDAVAACHAVVLLVRTLRELGRERPYGEAA